MCIVLSLVTLGYTIKEWHYPTHMRGWLVVGWGVHHRSQLLYVFVFAEPTSEGSFLSSCFLNI